MKISTAYVISTSTENCSSLHKEIKRPSISNEKKNWPFFFIIIIFFYVLDVCVCFAIAVAADGRVELLKRSAKEHKRPSFKKYIQLGKRYIRFKWLD